MSKNKIEYTAVTFLDFPRSDNYGVKIRFTDSPSANTKKDEHFSLYMLKKWTEQQYSWGGMLWITET